MITFTSLRYSNKKRAEFWHDGVDGWTGADWSNAMCGEAGEAANFVKKLRRYETGTKLAPDAWSVDDLIVGLGKELADIVIYADLLAQHYGLDLGKNVQDKFNEVSQRYGFDVVL
jgi:NTP pyrophosphatase (non-canonical NTP hydrolase)